MKAHDLADLNNKLVIVKIGSEDRPATEQDIKDAEKQIRKALKGIKCRIVVTHHCFDISIV